MSDGEETTTEKTGEESVETIEESTDEQDAQAESEATLDLEAAEERETSVEALREQVSDQQERIEKLEDLLLDLSARNADDGGTGVCPDCHGPVVKAKTWLRSPKIKCMKCGRIFHEY
jgi:predicted RNase H-like nuclease (RuvC/YqgF family)